MRRFETGTKENYLIGVIADTHGRLPNLVLKAFSSVDLIIHAGDIDEPEVLTSLEKIALTIAVRGNMDLNKWALQLPKNEIIKIGRILLYVLHDVQGFKFRNDSDTYDAVISGHTHRPKVEKKQGILFINPGSAVQPRFGYPASVALLRIKNTSIQARLLELKD
jgi:putative phosphoesterase